MGAGDEALIAVVVAYSPAPEQVELVAVQLPAGASVEDAVRESGLLSRHPEIDLGVQKVGVWAQLRPLGHVLRDGDRVEIYRPLKVDPKEARRQRYRSHKEKLSAPR